MNFMDTIKKDPNNFQKWMMSVHFMEESILVEKCIDRAGGVTVHEISPVDIERAFAPKVKFSTGLILPGTIYYSKSSQEETCVILIRKKLRDINLRMSSEKIINITVPMPNMIFWAVGNKYCIAALKDDNPTAESCIFNAPLPNADNDGQICQGAIKYPKCSMENIRKAEQMYWESCFNTDLNDNKSRSHIGDVTKLLMKIKNCKSFPLSELVPFQGHLTISRLISNLNGGKYEYD